MSDAPTPAAPVDPAVAQAFNAANAAFRAGDWTQALEQCERALRAAPDLGVAAILRARCLARLSRTEAALAAYEAALVIVPQSFDAWLEVGNIRRHLGQVDPARAAYERACALRPEDWRGHLALCRLLEETADAPSDQAAARYHLALEAARHAEGDVRVVQVHHDIARWRMARGANGAALEALRQALSEAAPGSLPRERLDGLRLDLAEVVLRLGLGRSAHEIMQEISRSEDDQTLTRLADLAYRFNLWPDAIAVLERNATLRLDDVDAWLRLAEMRANSWKLTDALDALRRSEAVGPVPQMQAVALRARIAGRMGKTEAAIEGYEALVEQGATGFASSLAMTLLYSDQHSPEEVAARHRSLFGVIAPQIRRAPADPDPGRPLRIGMVTGDLHRQHPVNIFSQPLLARWDHARYPLSVFFTGRFMDAQTARAQARATRWHVTDHAGLARLVAEDRIDILIDLAGHTSAAGIAAFAQRLAPVQVNFLGYPGTTGLPNMDWIIADPVTIPEGHERWYSERVARLPGCVFCYAPEADYPEPAFDTRMVERPLTFGSFNNLPKLTPGVVALWSRILVALPDARLLLKAPSLQDKATADRYRSLFVQEGVAPERLDLRGPSDLGQMMRDYGEVDIGLDPFPYTGGTTSLQAMWMGVPLITLEGGHFVGRMGASFLRAVGLNDWIARDDAQYLAIALRMAQDRAALLELKRGLRARLQSSAAGDIDRYADDFMSCLRSIWHSACQETG